MFQGQGQALEKKIQLAHVFLNKPIHSMVINLNHVHEAFRILLARQKVKKLG